jgi:hypothetical protein
MPHVCIFKYEEWLSFSYYTIFFLFGLKMGSLIFKHGPAFGLVLYFVVIYLYYIECSCAILIFTSRKQGIL